MLHEAMMMDMDMDSLSFCYFKLKALYEIQKDINNILIPSMHPSVPNPILFRVKEDLLEPVPAMQPVKGNGTHWTSCQSIAGQVLNIFKKKKKLAFL